MPNILVSKCTGIEIFGSLSVGKKEPKKRTSDRVRNVPLLTSSSEALSVSLSPSLWSFLAWLRICRRIEIFYKFPEQTKQGVGMHDLAYIKKNFLGKNQT